MSKAENSYAAEVAGVKLRAVISEDGIRIDGETVGGSLRDEKRLRSFTGTTAHGLEMPVYVEEGDDHEFIVYLRGEAVRVHLATPRDERILALRKNTMTGATSGVMIAAPMPGFLKAMLVEEGEIVEKGRSLCILEAMKMENEIKAPARLVVKRRIAAAGTAIEKGAPLVELAPPAEG
ncbi:MAG: hypothetical protein JST22_14415 [Bacteroidetes bacterium]|nr:hypothetical protein [Bacteroidota bacterium]